MGYKRNEWLAAIDEDIKKLEEASESGEGRVVIYIKERKICDWQKIEQGAKKNLTSGK